jgi:hypothetical protein
MHNYIIQAKQRDMFAHNADMIRGFRQSNIGTELNDIKVRHRLTDIRNNLVDNVT